MKPFIEAFSQKLKIEREQTNFAGWLSGMYVTHAISACFGKNHNYPSSPISLEAEDAAEKNRLDAQRFEALAISFNNSFKKETENKEA